jgi:hypothetical protein
MKGMKATSFENYPGVIDALEKPLLSKKQNLIYGSSIRF